MLLSFFVRNRLADKLVNIFQTRLCLIRIFVLQFLTVSGPVQNLFNQLLQTHISQAETQLMNQCHKRLYFYGCPSKPRDMLCIFQRLKETHTHAFRITLHLIK